MVAVNPLTYFVYSLVTLAANDEPSTGPSLSAWQDDSESWNQGLNFYKPGHQSAQQEDVIPPWPPVNPDWTPSSEMECPENERYDVCGRYCQKTCEDPEGIKPCPYSCLPACVCEEGFVRGTDGKCINQEECPEKPQAVAQDMECPENERYDICGNPCQKSCEDPEGIKPCPYSCFPACVCEEGFIRGMDGKCINPEECPEKPQAVAQEMNCSENEHYDICGRYCQKTCEDPEGTKPCPYKCFPACVCDEEFVRGPDEKCTKVEECPETPQAEAQAIVMSGGCPSSSECSTYCERQGFDFGVCEGAGNQRCSCRHYI